jgi:hypothetical protein
MSGVTEQIPSYDQTGKMFFSSAHAFFAARYKKLCASQWTACLEKKNNTGAQPSTRVQHRAGSYKGETVPLITPFMRWGRRQWRRHLKQIAPFREIGFLQTMTGTFPRVKVAPNNQRAGGQQPSLLGFT